MSVVEFGFNVVICVVAWLIVVWVFKKTPFYKRNEDTLFFLGTGYWTTIIISMAVRLFS